jgi:hypothetical protein
LIDVVRGLILGLVAWAEGTGTSKELKGKHTYCPVVNFVVVRDLLEELGSKVVRGAAECHPVLVYGVSAPAEVAELDVPGVRVSDEDVLRLDVSMDDVPLLQEPKRRNDLLNDFTHNLFRKVVNSLQLLVQVALWHEFQNTEDMVVVIKVRKKLCDIWVIGESILYLQLFLHLRVEIILGQQCFLHSLDRHCAATLDMRRLVDISKLAFANLVEVLEIRLFEWGDLDLVLRIQTNLAASPGSAAGRELVVDNRVLTLGLTIFGIDFVFFVLDFGEA